MSPVRQRAARWLIPVAAALLIPAAAALAGCDSTAPETLLLGRWSDSVTVLTATPDSAVVHFPCAWITVDRPLGLAADSSFTAAGHYRAGLLGPHFDVRLTGTVTASGLTLRVVPASGAGVPDTRYLVPGPAPDLGAYDCPI